MPARYYLKIMNPDGTNPQYISPNQVTPGANDPTKSGIIDLAYNNQVNDIGVCKFILTGNHAVLPTLVNNAQVEVWRMHYDPLSGTVDVPWYRSWSGLFKDEYRYYSGGESLFEATCYSDMWWLQDSYVEWYAGTTNRSQFTGVAAETVEKTIVDYNCCANATAANSRLRDHVITGLSIETSGGHGNTIDWACAYGNVLDELKKLWPVAGGDYDLVKTGLQTWQFRWYTGQRGTDRSASVLFSLDNGNMSNPQYRYTRSAEKTVTVVGGQANGTARAIVIRTGPNYNVSTNNVETFTQANMATTTATLNAVGDSDLVSKRAPETLDFGVLQTPACQVDLHYYLGDYVTGRYNASISKKIKIISTAFAFRQGQETVAVGLLNV